MGREGRSGFMIKRIRKIVVITLLGIILTGCGEKEEEIDLLSQDMMNKIETIGDVTIEDKELIEDLMETYAGMTERQKDQVKNYLTLKNAKDELDVLLENQQAQDEAAQKEENELIFKEQRKHYDLVNEGVMFLKSKCKHPASLKISGVIITYYLTGDTFGPDVNFEYSADNDLGNSVSNYARYSNYAGQYLETRDYVQSSYLDYDNVISGGEKVASNKGLVEKYNKEADNAYSYQPGNDRICVFKRIDKKGNIK